MYNCTDVLEYVIRTFVDESKRYFQSVIDIELFDLVFSANASMAIREKKGTSDLATEISKIIFPEDSSRITKKSINQVLAWLYNSGIIGYCGKASECNFLDVSFNRRVYFLDVGVARYFMNRSGVLPEDLDGFIAENFVYLEMLRFIKDRKISGLTPIFGDYKGGEIDFLARSQLDYQDYAIEVKAGNNSGKAANMLLNDGKVKYVYFLKGNTVGGIDGRKITIPIALAGRLDFNLGSTKQMNFF